MLYNNERKEWEHADDSQGYNRVHVYHHLVNNTYRIVGRNVEDESVCLQLINFYSFLVLAWTGPHTYRIWSTSFRLVVT